MLNPSRVSPKLGNYGGADVGSCQPLLPWCQPRHCEFLRAGLVLSFLLSAIDVSDTKQRDHCLEII